MAPLTWSEDFSEFLQPYAPALPFSLVSLAVWGSIHIAASKYFASKYAFAYGQTTKASDAKKGKKVKSDEWYTSHANWEMSIKVTAFVHAVVSSIGALIAIVTADKWVFSVENLYRQDSLQRLTVGISCGYFLYDLIVATIGQDIPFLIHGSMSSVIYMQSFGKQFCLSLGCFFLLYEFSTVFLNIRALMIATGNGKHSLFPLMEKLFFGTFMFFRMVIGLGYSLFVTLPVLAKSITQNATHSVIASAVLMVANCAINGLNVMWSKAMIDILQGRGRGPKPSTAATTTATTDDADKQKKAD